MGDGHRVPGLFGCPTRGLQDIEEPVGTKCGIDTGLDDFPADRNLAVRILLHEYGHLWMIHDTLLLEFLGNRLPSFCGRHADNLDSPDHGQQNVAFRIDAAMDREVWRSKDGNLELVTRANAQTLDTGFGTLALRGGAGR